MLDQPAETKPESKTDKPKDGDALSKEAWNKDGKPETKETAKPSDAAKEGDKPAEKPKEGDKPAEKKSDSDAVGLAVSMWDFLKDATSSAYNKVTDVLGFGNSDQTKTTDNNGGKTYLDFSQPITGDKPATTAPAAGTGDVSKQMLDATSSLDKKPTSDDYKWLESEFVDMFGGGDASYENKVINFFEGDKASDANAAKSASVDGKTEVHTTTDANGNPVTVEVGPDGRKHEGQGFSTSEAPNGDIHRVGPDGTTFDKSEAGVIIKKGNMEWDEATQSYKSADGKRQMVKNADGTFSYIKDGVERAKMDSEGHPTYINREVQATQVEPGTDVKKAVVQQQQAADDPNKVHVATDGQGNSAAAPVEGGQLVVDQKNHKAVYTMKDGSEIDFERGKHWTYKDKDGKEYELDPRHLDASKLPPGFKLDEQGRLVFPNGVTWDAHGMRGRHGFHWNADNGKIEAGTGDQKVTVDGNPAKPTDPTIVAADGTQIGHDTKGNPVILDNGKPVLAYDKKTGDVTADGGNLTWHKDDSVTTWNGDRVYKDGHVDFANGDHLNRDGSIAFADGTSFNKDGSVSTSDGWSARGESSPEAAKAQSVSGDASNIAGAVAGKVNSGTVDFGDIAQLQASLGDIQALMPLLIAQGRMDAVAQLQSAAGLVESTLNLAIPRAQAAEQAKALGITSPMELAQIENSIGSGKTPEQAVKSYVDGQGH